VSSLHAISLTGSVENRSLLKINHFSFRVNNFFLTFPGKAERNV
jgi:hypothetical protein